MNTDPSLNALRDEYREFCDLRGALSLLQWDEQTYMPPRGCDARARQIAALTSILHERLISPRYDELLEKAHARESELSDDERAFLRELEFDRDRERKLPAELVRELALEQSRAFASWQVAKRDRDFPKFAPHLTRLLELSRQKADCYGWEGTPWNALVPDFERGMTADRITRIFMPLREATVALLDQIRGAKPIDAGFLDQPWDVARQRELGLRIAADLGFDFESGRQDVSTHPFTSGIAHGDCRFTTRFAERGLMDALGSTTHETGHALYDQGCRVEDDGTPLAGAPSYGVHESQSRFWEVYVGKSRAFWAHYLPIARQSFPGQLSEIGVERLYRAINRVVPGLIRIEADEVTYNLHIIIRFEIELLLLEGKLPIADLPAEWNRRYREYLGVQVPNDGQGCLQDVHWSLASFSYFPSYTFGNMYAAMLVEKMEHDIPGLWEAVEGGEFSVPLGWLRTHIHRVGRRMLPLELIEHVCGIPVSADALIRHLNEKYGEIYLV